MAANNDISTGVRADGVCLNLNARQFSREAVVRASYWLSKDLHIDIPPCESEEIIQVILRPRSEVPTLDNPRPKSLEDLVVEFKDSLIDAELRVQVLRETSAVRELLLAKAFAEAGVLEDGPPGSFDDPVSTKSTTESPATLVSIEGGYKK